MCMYVFWGIGFSAQNRDFIWRIKLFCVLLWKWNRLSYFLMKNFYLFLVKYTTGCQDFLVEFVVFKTDRLFCYQKLVLIYFLLTFVFENYCRIEYKYIYTYLKNCVFVPIMIG